MIIIDDINNCTGCGLCFDRCPHKAIILDYNNGFLYPEIEVSKCTECGLCRKVCPQNSFVPINSKKVFAAYSKDEYARMSSSSGGIFTELSNIIIAKGGIVFGVKYDNDWNPVFDCASTIEECEKFKVSKYAEANLENIYPLIAEKISTNKIILFTGLPCQVSAINNRFPRATNLFTVDLICNSVPSNIVLQEYLKAIKMQEGDITYLNMRYKKTLWEQSLYYFKIYKNDKFLIRTSDKHRLINSYKELFFGKFSTRKSCFNCKYRGINRSGDLSIGDFWNINSIVPDMNDGKGTSIVLVNSQEGESLLKSLYINLKEVNLEKVLQSRCIPTDNPVMPSSYSTFWNDFESNGYIYVAKKYTTYGTWNYIRHRIGNILRRMLRYIKY